MNYYSMHATKSQQFQVEVVRLMPREDQVILKAVDNSGEATLFLTHRQLDQIYAAIDAYYLAGQPSIDDLERQNRKECHQQNGATPEGMASTYWPQ